MPRLEWDTRGYFHSIIPSRLWSSWERVQRKHCCVLGRRQPLFEGDQAPARVEKHSRLGTPSGKIGHFTGRVVFVCGRSDPQWCCRGHFVLLFVIFFFCFLSRCIKLRVIHFKNHYCDILTAWIQCHSIFILSNDQDFIIIV